MAIYVNSIFERELHIRLDDVLPLHWWIKFDQLPQIYNYHPIPWVLTKRYFKCSNISWKIYLWFHLQVQQLIQDAIDSERLCQMFPGWGAWLWKVLLSTTPWVNLYRRLVYSPLVFFPLNSKISFSFNSSLASYVLIVKRLYGHVKGCESNSISHLYVYVDVCWSSVCTVGFSSKALAFVKLLLIVITKSYAVAFTLDQNIKV